MKQKETKQLELFSSEYIRRSSVAKDPKMNILFFHAKHVDFFN